METPMENQKDQRVCPTRIDGETALFAHKVTLDKCNERQRGRYHKCYTCVHNHSYDGRPSIGLRPQHAAAGNPAQVKAV